jgi:phosphocarrier protein HPr
MEPARRTFEVQNRLGLHMRAAAMLVQTANKYDAQVTITKDGQSVDGKSIISLMILAAAQGSVIEIEAVGSQAEELLDALGALFDRKFDEE